MKNSKANGSPVSQNGRNVNTFSEKIFNGFCVVNRCEPKRIIPRGDMVKYRN